VPSKDAILNAMAKLGGHNAEAKEIFAGTEPLQVAEKNDGSWRARRDSNPRPIAPEDLPHKKSTS